MPEEISSVVPLNFQELLNDNSINNLYINGFSMGHTLTEAHLILMEHGKPKAIAQMPLTIVKTLAVGLNNLVSSFEETTKQQVKSLEEIQNSQLEAKKV